MIKANPERSEDAMKNRDSIYQLTGIVDIDDSFFGSSTKGRSKRGRGTSKTAVIVVLLTANSIVVIIK